MKNGVKVLNTSVLALYQWNDVWLHCSKLHFGFTNSTRELMQKRNAVLRHNTCNLEEGLCSFAGACMKILLLVFFENLAQKVRERSLFSYLHENPFAAPMPLSENWVHFNSFLNRRGTRYDVDPLWPDGHQETGYMRFIPTAKTWLHLGFSIPKVIRKGPSKIFN